MGFIEDPEENPTTYALALKLDMSECLEPHLAEQPRGKTARKPKK